MYYIGLDLGTSALKLLLMDEKGVILNIVSEEYPISFPKPGWSEQNPVDWWQAVVDGITELIKDVDKDKIQGISFGGQMHGLVMLDKDDQVIRPAILWNDGRTVEECDYLNYEIGKERLSEYTANIAFAGFTAPKILWVKKHEPENYQKCRHILLPKDYIRQVLTGVFATEVSDASGMQLLDVQGRCWSEEVLRALDIDRSLLGEVYESCEITGTLLPEIAERTGLNADTIVVGGAGDNAAAAVGTGVVADGAAFTTIGTSGVVYAHSSKLAVDPKGRVHTCCCAVPGAWHMMGVTQAAGLSLKWFCGQFCQDYMVEAERQGRDVYDLVNEAVQEIKPGSDRLIYLPYLMGERTPHLDPDCRGVFFGLSAIHTKSHLLRAVMEGVAYSLFDCSKILGDTGVKITEMMACGGGGKSPVWRQMLADLYGCPVKTVKQQEGPALGAAILAGVGCGIYNSVETACGRLLRMSSSTEPEEENTVLYRQFHCLYQRLYSSLKEDFKELAGL